MEFVENACSRSRHRFKLRDNEHLKLENFSEICSKNKKEMKSGIIGNYIGIQYLRRRIKINFFSKISFLALLTKCIFLINNRICYQIVRKRNRKLILSRVLIINKINVLLLFTRMILLLLLCQHPSVNSVLRRSKLENPSFSLCHFPSSCGQTDILIHLLTYLLTCLCSSEDG